MVGVDAARNIMYRDVRLVQRRCTTRSAGDPIAVLTGTCRPISTRKSRNHSDRSPFAAVRHRAAGLGGPEPFARLSVFLSSPADGRRGLGLAACDCVRRLLRAARGVRSVPAYARLPTATSDYVRGVFRQRPLRRGGQPAGAPRSRATSRNSRSRSHFAVARKTSCPY